LTICIRITIVACSKVYLRTRRLTVPNNNSYMPKKISRWTCKTIQYYIVYPHVIFHNDIGIILLCFYIRACKFSRRSPAMVGAEYPSDFADILNGRSEIRYDGVFSPSLLRFTSVFNRHGWRISTVAANICPPRGQGWLKRLGWGE